MRCTHRESAVYSFSIHKQDDHSNEMLFFVLHNILNFEVLKENKNDKNIFIRLHKNFFYDINYFWFFLFLFFTSKHTSQIYKEDKNKKSNKN